MIDVMQAQPRLRTFQRAEYDALVELGFFQDEHIELLDGLIVHMSSKTTLHYGVIQKLTMLLAAAVAGEADVRVQSPLAVSDDSEPEPDLAVVHPDAGVLPEHPQTAYLVIEVAGDSLRTDRLVKTRLYAAAVPEYWIVNLGARTVEVYTEPGAEGYGRLATLRPADTAVLTAFPTVTLRVSDFLPPA